MLRSLLAALLLLALIPAAALANTSVWASRTVLDRATFQAAVVDALEDPDLKGVLTVRLTRELYGALIENDDRARLVLGQAFALGEDPSDREVLDALQPRVGAALDDPQATAARDALVGDVHDVLAGRVPGSGRVTLVEDHLVVDVRDILDAIAVSLRSSLGGVLLTVPPDVATEIRLEDAPGLGAARDGLSTLERTALILPLLAVLLALLIVLVSHRRARAVGIVGAATVIAGLTGIAIVLFGGVALARSGADINPVLLDGTVGAFSGVLLVQSAILVGIGLVLAFVAAVAGARAGRRARRAEAALDDW